MKRHNKTAKKRNKYANNQRGKGFGSLIGSIASEAMGSGGFAPAAGGGAPQVSAATSSTKDIMYASEIAGKELIQKICQSLNPPNSQVFLNIAADSVKTYLEGEDAKRMMDEELKAFVGNIFDGFLNENKPSQMLFLQTLVANKDAIEQEILIPAITKQIAPNKIITLAEIPDLVDAIMIGVNGTAEG